MFIYRRDILWKILSVSSKYDMANQIEWLMDGIPKPDLTKFDGKQVFNVLKQILFFFEWYI